MLYRVSGDMTILNTMQVCLLKFQLQKTLGIKISRLSNLVSMHFKTEMVRGTKTPVATPDDLSYTPRVHTAGVIQHYQVLTVDAQVYTK